MNKLASQFISSMQGMLGFASTDEAQTSIRIDGIRQAMLDAIGKKGCPAHPTIERRVLFAPDLQGLWYLRSDVMIALSSLYGETVAQEKIQRITGLFEGLLPKGMMSRPGALRR